MTVRLSLELKEFMSGHIGAAGSYESASEYIRGLIRQDKESMEQREAIERLRGELQHAFGEPEASCQALTAAEVIARNRA